MSVAETSPYYDAKDSADLQIRHDLAKAKLYGFIDHPTTTRRRYDETDMSVPARYARAIAFYKEAQTDKSIALIETLIDEYPENPWFHEFKGQALFEGGRAKAAIQPYRDSLALRPDEPLLMIGLAAALVAEDQNNLQQKRTPEAIALLRQAIRDDNENLTAYMQLSKAYGQIENIGLAEWALAEYYALIGSPQATMHAQKAIKILPPRSPESMRSQDISEQVFAPSNPKRR
jgi:predicted Zn-dependent protease